MGLPFQCQNSAFTSETFMTVIKTSDNVDELKAVKEKVDLDIARQRSRDTGGNDGNAKNHLKKVKIHLLYHSLEFFF